MVSGRDRQLLERPATNCQHRNTASNNDLWQQQPALECTSCAHTSQLNLNSLLDASVFELRNVLRIPLGDNSDRIGLSGAHSQLR